MQQTKEEIKEAVRQYVMALRQGDLESANRSMEQICRLSTSGNHEGGTDEAIKYL